MCLGVRVESIMHLRVGMEKKAHLRVWTEQKMRLGAGAVQRMQTFVPTRAYSDFWVDNVIKKKDEE